MFFFLLMTVLVQTFWRTTSNHQNHSSASPSPLHNTHQMPTNFSAGASYENTLVEVRVWIMLDYLRSTLRIGANHVSEMKSGRREYGAGGTYTTDPSSIYLVRRPKCFVVLTDNQWRTELWRWPRRDCSRKFKKPM